MMLPCFLLVSALATGSSDKLGPGDHTRTVEIDGRKRTYLIHVPKKHDPGRPTAVVLALHGAAMNGPMMVKFCGMNVQADKYGFLVVYPSGTGFGPFLAWNAGGFRKGRGSTADDVAFLGKVLDDVGKVAAVDRKRVFACGMSNGGMMCYRLAAEMPDRIAAIAPVAGTLTIEPKGPKRPVPVLHIHGTKDSLVPFDKVPGKALAFARLRSVPESIEVWRTVNGCPEKPRSEDVLSRKGADLKVTRTVYGPGKKGSEVVLIRVEGGGHTWPGMRPPLSLIGASTLDFSANEAIWEFFRKHPLP